MKKATLVSLFLACFAMTPALAMAGPPASVTKHDPQAKAVKRVELLGFDICLEPEGVPDSKTGAKTDASCDLKLRTLDSPVPAVSVAKKIMFAVLPDVLDGTFEPQQKGVTDAKQG